MPKINIPQLGRTIDVENGVVLMRALLAEGIPVASSCNGDGICGKCRIFIHQGEDTLTPPNDHEIILKEKFQFQNGVRISCQVTVHGDIEVRTSYW